MRCQQGTTKEGTPFCHLVYEKRIFAKAESSVQTIITINDNNLRVGILLNTSRDNLKILQLGKSRVTLHHKM